MDGGPAATGVLPHRWQPADAESLGAPMEDLRGPLRSLGCQPGGAPTSESAYAPGRDPRGGIDLLSQQSQAPPLSGGAEAADLRNLWSGVDLAWSPNGLDSRPRERNEKRQPDRELRIICPNCAATLDTHCGRK